METAEWIADAQARCDAATEAPWTPQHPNASESYVYAMDARYPSLPGNPSPVKVAWVPWSPGDERDTNDTAFIAAARQDLPRALAALRAVLDLCDADESSPAGRGEVTVGEIRMAILDGLNA